MALALLVSAGLGSCGSSGVQTQSPAPPKASDSPTSLTPTSSATSSTTDAPTRTTGFGNLQPAIDVYVSLTAAYNKALQDPADASPSTFSRFVAGQARIAFEQSLAQEKAEGKAFRGTPPVNRLVVKSSDLTASVPSATLENCVLASRTNPWIEYIVATGKAAPTGAPPKVPPPYPATIKLFKPNAAGWVVTSYALDGTKTCTR
ncbi:hypothetical protein [uncultured Jatrophihabitans sp.]|uniref:hypothetical protein n=1 Tax=uncultured Jatrophihabitans sp. TaxID=1610747 RepID=UPI0035CA109B